MAEVIMVQTMMIAMMVTMTLMMFEGKAGRGRCPIGFLRDGIPVEVVVISMIMMIVMKER
jgi:hypothetical protein